MMPVASPHDLECEVESCPVILRTHAIIRSIKGITSEQDACLSQARDQPAKYNAPINVKPRGGRPGKGGAFDSNHRPLVGFLTVLMAFLATFY